MQIAKLLLTIGLFLMVGAVNAQASLVSVLSAQGSPTITITEGTSFAQAFVRITASGDPLATLSGATIAFSVGDGGAVLGGTDVAPITAVSFIQPGSIFTGSSILLGDPNPALPASSAVVTTVNLATPNSNVSYAANTLLAVFTINTSALTSTGGSGGAYVLDANAFGLTVIERALGGGSFINFTFATMPGTLLVTAVPEPGTIGLLGLAALSLLLRRSSLRKKII